MHFDSGGGGKKNTCAGILLVQEAQVNLFAEMTTAIFYSLKTPLG